MVLGGGCIDASIPLVPRLPASPSCCPHPCLMWIFSLLFFFFFSFPDQFPKFPFVSTDFLVASLPSSCDVWLFGFQFATESEWACSQTRFLSVCTVTCQLSKTLSKELAIFSHIFLNYSSQPLSLLLSPSLGKLTL